MHRLASIAVAAATALAVAGCSSDATTGSTGTDDSVSATASDTTVTTPTTMVTDTTSPGSDTMSTASGSTSVSGTTSTLALDDRLSQATDALQEGDFTTMLQLLRLSGLADQLEGREATILAPTEGAFSSLSGDDLEELIGNPSRIDDVLKRHVIDGLFTYDELAQETEVTMMSGDTLPVSNANGVLTVGGAEVSEPSADSMSGKSGEEIVVLGIDKVLLEG